jgi:hypothetical protein
MTICEAIIARLEAAPGKDNAITGERLAIDILGGARAIRIIQQKIQHLRSIGYPICGADSGKMGYFIPATEAEADAFFASLRARVKSSCITLANVQKALNKRFVTDKYQVSFLANYPLSTRSDKCDGASFV